MQNLFLTPAQAIILACARDHGILVSRLRSPSRVTAVQAARVGAMRRLRDELGLSYAEIGRMVGRNGATVMYFLVPGFRERKHRANADR